MYLIIQVLVLVGFVRLLLATGNPILCAGIYAGIGLVLKLLFGVSVLWAVPLAAAAFFLAWLYFWLLNRTHGSVLFWLILFAGFLLGLV